MNPLEPGTVRHDATQEAPGAGPHAELALAAPGADGDALQPALAGARPRGFDDATCPALVYLRSLGSRQSRYSMGRALQCLARLLRGLDPAEPEDIDLRTVPWASLRYEHTSALRAQIVERYAPATANRLLAALRGTLKQAARLGLCSREEAAVACELGSARRDDVLAGRWVRGDEVRAVFAAAGDDARLRAMLALLYGCGLRRSELVGLRLEHYSRSERAITFRGKRNKLRVAYLNRSGVEALEAWLLERGDAPGPLIPSNRGGGASRLQPMSPEGVRKVLARLAAQAGVEPFTPHDLRRTFVSDLLDRGVDPITVSKLVGHDDPKTTKRYDRRGEQQAREAVEKLGL